MAIIQRCGVCLIPEMCSAFVFGEEKILTHAQMLVLTALMNRAGSIVTREQLLAKLHGAGATESKKLVTIDDHIKNLKIRLFNGNRRVANLFISCEYGIGYRVNTRKQMIGM